ncbi:hypothetical protein AGMMS49949_01030 [Alphaproteobacteria bacterium]|nr:hypothetical protein AGMMS49949_01030 [Alphaproteobacteria bacterium]GHS95942.1 hypothetical protein AGMMS50296_1510 [Alphaproteobacteria bacterium]
MDDEKKKTNKVGNVKGGELASPQEVTAEKAQIPEAAFEKQPLPKGARGGTTRSEKFLLKKEDALVVAKKIGESTKKLTSKVNSLLKDRIPMHGDGPTPPGGNRWAKILLILVVAGLSLWALVRISHPILVKLAQYILREEKTDADTYYSREITVEAEKTVSETMPKHINTVGELKANASVMIHSELNGCIKEVAFVEGASVGKGDLLIKFEDEQFQADLRLAQAQYQAAKTEFERFEKMKASGAGSQKDYDKAQAEMNMSKAKVEGAEVQIRKTEIRAPFDGTIGLIDVGVGSFVQPNQELVMLVDQTPIKVKFGIPGKFVNDVGVGQSVELKVESSKKRVFRGIVEAVDSHVDTTTNCVSVRASVPNEDGVLKAGLFVAVSLVVGEQGDVITVDEAAIERMGEQEFVWIVDRGKARRVGILTGVHEKGRVEVIAGLKAGQVVVVSGQLRLSEGRWVKVTNMSESEPKKTAETTEAPEKESKKEAAPEDSQKEDAQPPRNASPT